MTSYQVEVTSEVRKDIRRLPGHVRQRIIRTLKALREDPLPDNSRTLDTVRAEIELEPGTRLSRIRIVVWRIIYLVEEEHRLVSVLAIRKRPPYQYDDLAELLRDK